MNTFEILKFKADFKEGIYSNGIHMIEAWWDYEKTSVLFNDEQGSHSGMYPIVFYTIVLNNYDFIGEV